MNQARRDQDRDQLRNRAEFLAGTNPRDADTDNDGVEDGKENAGDDRSRSTRKPGKLTIALFGGDTISGWSAIGRRDTSTDDRVASQGQTRTTSRRRPPGESD